MADDIRARSWRGSGRRYRCHGGSFGDLSPPTIVILEVGLLTRGGKERKRRKTSNRSRSEISGAGQRSSFLPLIANPPPRADIRRMPVRPRNHDRSTSRREAFRPRRDQNPRSRGSASMFTVSRPPPAALHYVPREMKKYRAALSAHEYRIRRSGLCTLEASPAPFSKLNYLSPVDFPPVRRYSAARAFCKFELSLRAIFRSRN